MNNIFICHLIKVTFVRMIIAIKCRYNHVAITHSLLVDIFLQHLAGIRDVTALANHLIFATIWMISISVFLIAEPSWGKLIEHATNWTYISAIFIDIALLGYINWHEKYGKIITCLFIIFGLAISIVFASNPYLLYSKIILTNTGNRLVTNINPFYFVYITFFCILVPTVILSLFRQVLRTESIRKRNSDLVLLVGFAISGTTSLVCNLILPFWTWDFIWLGPIAISTTIIAFYYSILRYRSLTISSIWLKLLSYVVIITSIAIVYMIIFSLSFPAMFRGSAPSI